jgi:tRNA(fMet)-specific endonuclease VapC
VLRFLFDTDHLTLLQHGQPTLTARVATQPTGAVGVGAVTVEESLRGRLAALAIARTAASRIARYGHLLDTVEFLNRWPMVSYDHAAETQFQHLLSLRLRIGNQDLKIAAITLANNLTLLTRNVRDFGRVPGLALDDWSV